MATEEENNDKAASKRVPRKKKTLTPKLSAIDDKTPIQQNINKQVEEVIKQAFLRFYDDATIHKAKVKDLEHLDNIASEYLRAYVILGYDINGEKVSIMHANSPHDKDAVIEHLRSTLINILGD